jgi:4,5-DOPA dioxygenase extradiol
MLLSVPAPEHYLSLLYMLGIKGNKDAVIFIDDKAVAGSVIITFVNYY